MKMDIQNTFPTSAATNVVDDAVGMSKSYWFVAIIHHNSEKRVAEKLDKLNVVYYLPLQTEHRIWKNGRKVKVERVVIPSTIFIYCSEQQRKEIVGLPYIKRFMVNNAGLTTKSGHKPLAIIPDNQIKSLKFMIGNSESPVTITKKPFQKGDLVKVIRGKLRGLKGEIMNLNNDRSELVVSLDFFGCAKLTIDTINVEIMSNK